MQLLKYPVQYSKKPTACCISKTVTNAIVEKRYKNSIEMLAHLQSDVEKLEGLPVAPFMDREKVSKPSSQVGFIRFVLLPLFESLGQLFPQLEVSILTITQLHID